MKMNRRSNMVVLASSLFFVIMTVALARCGGGSSGGGTAPVPSIVGTFGSLVTFATHTELAGFGFSFGPSDGQFGAISTRNVIGV